MKLSQFRPPQQHGPSVHGSAALSPLNDDEALQAFGSESEPSAAPAHESARHKTGVKLRVASAAALPLAIAALLGVTVGAGGLRAYQVLVQGRTAASLRIETSLPGTEVLVDGKAAGRTPLTVSLPAGSYPVQLAGVGGVRRDFTVSLAAGSSVVRHVDMPVAGRAAAAVGSLLVQTEPARLAVFVDGVERGVSPLTVEGLTPGEHQVAVRGDGSIVRRTVTVQANENTVLVLTPVERAAPPVAAGASGGFLAISAPFYLRIREAGKVLGSTDVERLMLPAGEHTLELINEPLGYQGKRTVRIEAGKTVAVKIEPPNGVLSINAQPWAEVWVDGQRIGETPIGNLARPIGTHEVVLRHPDLGERRETVTVSLKQPARLGVDMRKK
jgi:hypothetical protein